MRWYPRGIQKLVSTYELPETWRGDYSRPTQTQTAKICPNLHLGGGRRGRGVVFQTNSTQSVMICPIICIGGGGCSRPTQPKVSQSVQHLHLGDGGGPDQLNPKCQDLSKSALEGGVVFETNSTQSAKICPNLHFWWWWWWWGGSGVQTHSTQSAKICPNLHLGEGGGGRGWWFRPTFLKYLSGATQRILNQKFWKPSLLLHHR